MNTLLISGKCRAGLALAAGWAGFTLLAPAGFAADSKADLPSYDNYIDVAAGTTDLHGPTGSYQKLFQQNKNGWGGLEGFHYSQDLDKNTTLTLDGHALVGNENYKFVFKVNRDGVGFVTAGFTQFRTYFNGNGGFFPPSDYFPAIYGDDLHIDRSDLWLEAGTNRDSGVNFDLRYDYTTRKGTKDSTEWGDTTNTAGTGTRNIVPTFYRIHEHRHILNAKISDDAEPTSWELVGHYEKSSLDNAREERRTPGSATTDRYQTQVNQNDDDLFMVRGSAESKLSDLLMLTTGVAHYNLDTNLGGSKIAGDDGYDPVFDPNYARRQAYDEGFLNLNGTTRMRETLGNLSLMYTPTEHLSIVPAIRAEKTTWGANADYVETAVHPPLSNPVQQDEDNSESNKDFKTITGMVEGHYTGIKDVVLNSSLEWTRGNGTLTEDLIAKETGVDSIYRTTDFRRKNQKYEVMGAWYVEPGLSYTVQYYWQGEQNSFNDTRLSVNQSPASGDRYPGYITHQDTETNDVNVRMTWSPTLTVHTVTRYDYQKSTIRSQEMGLDFIQSANTTANILSESVTWNPLDRWYLQASGNVVFDRTTTPAHDLTGPAGGIVLNSDNNYWDYQLGTGYAVSDAADLSATYTYTRAADYADNSQFSVPYGASFTDQRVSLIWTQRLSANLNYTLKYTYGDFKDPTSGGNNNFHANVVYAKVQYRF